MPSHFGKELFCAGLPEHRSVNGRGKGLALQSMPNPLMSSSKRYEPRPKDAATLKTSGRRHTDVENDSCPYSLSRPVRCGPTSLVSSRQGSSSSSLRRLAHGLRRCGERSKPPTLEAKQQKADRDPCITNMQDEDERITHRSHSAPARKSKELGRAGEHQREAGQPIVRESRATAARASAVDDDHQQVEALPAASAARASFLCFAIQLRVKDGMIRPPIREMRIMISAIGASPAEVRGNLCRHAPA